MAKPKDTEKLRIDQARWWVVSSTDPKVVFYGQMSMRLKDAFSTDFPTAATDGESIYWNRDFVARLNDEELRFVLLHETMHPAHGHPWRLPTTEQGNQAGDFAINRILSTIPGIKMPKGGLLDRQYDGLAEEEILKRLQAKDGNQGQNGQGKPGGPSCQNGQGTPGQNGQGTPGQNGQGTPDPCGSFVSPKSSSDKPGQDAVKSKQIREGWERAVIQASQIQGRKGLGSLPADLQRELERVQARHIDWRQSLADFVRTAIGTRNDWSRSARRHAWQPVIYPRKQRDQIGTIVFARDTSGSVDDRTAAMYSACISAAMAEVGCAGIVLDCDTAIKQELHLAPGETCPLTAQGGGGTHFQPVFDRASELAENGEPIAGIVYLTDLCGRFPSDPGIPTLWIATENHPVPFGNVVRIMGS